jgi:hypothetical protein
MGIKHAGPQSGRVSPDHGRGSRLLTLGLVTLAILSGCEAVDPGNPEGPGEPVTGEAVITILESGDDLDLDGYELTIDGGPVRKLGGRRSLIVPDLAVGVHDAEIGGTEPNCVAKSPLKARFSVIPGARTTVAFSIECIATGVRITLAAEGLDGPAEYSVMVDGRKEGSIRPSSEARITRMYPGAREIELGSVPPNCTIPEPRSRTVTLAAGDILPVAFAVVCVATRGLLRISGVTQGEDLDPNGYSLNIDTSTRKDIGFLGDRVATMLIPAGAHIVALDEVAKNCSVDAPSLRSIEVSGGGLVRDTVDIVFEITCRRAYRFALVRAGKLGLGAEVGDPVEVTVRGDHPVWAPDGKSIVYSCGGFGLCRLGLDRAPLPGIPTPGPVRGISWNPGGTRIAYVFDCAGSSPDCRDGLVLVAPDGSQNTRLPLPLSVWDLHGVSWSPDGARMAFGCSDYTRNAYAICTVALDGSGFVRMAEAGGWDPAWSPDGSKILFTGYDQGTEIGAPYVMNADGSAIRRIDRELRGWSGGWISSDTILFSAGWCDWYYGCWSDGIISSRIDGTDRVWLSRGNDASPAWRP